MFKLLRTILILVAAFVGVVFAYFNTARVNIDFLFGEQEMPVVLALAGVLLVGLAIGVLLGLPYTMRTRSDLSVTRRRLQQAETEIKNLRNQPINDA